MAFSLSRSPTRHEKPGTNRDKNPTAKRRHQREQEEDEKAPTSRSLQSPVSFSLSESDDDKSPVSSASSESSLNTMLRDFHRQPITIAKTTAKKSRDDKSRFRLSPGKMNGGFSRAVQERTELDQDSGVSPLPKLTKLPKPKPTRPSLMLQPKRYPHKSMDGMHQAAAVDDDDLLGRKRQRPLPPRSPSFPKRLGVATTSLSHHHGEQPRNPSPLRKPAHKTARVLPTNHDPVQRTSRLTSLIKRFTVKQPDSPRQIGKLPQKSFSPTRIRTSSPRRGLKASDSDENEPSAPHKPSRHDHQRVFFQKRTHQDLHDDEETEEKKERDDPRAGSIDDLITNDIHELNHLIYSAKATSRLSSPSRSPRKSPQHKTTRRYPRQGDNEEDGKTGLRDATRFRKPKPTEFAHLEISLSPFRSPSPSHTRSPRAASSVSPSRKSPTRPSSSWQVKSYRDEKEQEDEEKTDHSRPNLEEALSFAEELSEMRRKQNHDHSAAGSHHGLHRFKAIALAARAAASKSFNSASDHQQRELMEGKTADRIREAAHKIDQTLLLALQPFENARKEKEAEEAKAEARKPAFIDGPLSTASKTIVQDLDQAFAGMNQKAQEVAQQEAKEEAQKREHRERMEQQEQEVKYRLTKGLFLRDDADIEAALERLDQAEAEAREERRNHNSSSPKNKPSQESKPSIALSEPMQMGLEKQLELLRLQTLEKMQAIDNQMNHQEEDQLRGLSPVRRTVRVDDQDATQALFSRTMYTSQTSYCSPVPRFLRGNSMNLDGENQRTIHDTSDTHHEDNQQQQPSFEQVVKNKVLDKLDYAILKLKHKLEIDTKEAQEAEAKRKQQEAIEKQTKADKELQEAKAKKQQEDSKRARDRVMGVRYLEELEEWRETRQVTNNPAEILALAAMPLESEYARLPSFFDDAKVLDRFDQMRAAVERRIHTVAPLSSEREPQHPSGYFDVFDSPPDSSYDQDSDEFESPQQCYPRFPASRRSMRPEFSNRRSKMSPRQSLRRESTLYSPRGRRHQSRQSLVSADRQGSIATGMGRHASGVMFDDFDQRQSVFPSSPPRRSAAWKDPPYPSSPRRNDSQVLTSVRSRNGPQGAIHNPRDSFALDPQYHQPRHHHPAVPTTRRSSMRQQKSPSRTGSVMFSESSEPKPIAVRSPSRYGSHMRPRGSFTNNQVNDAASPAKRHGPSSQVDLREFSSTIQNFQSKRRQKADWLRGGPSAVLNHEMREN